MVYGIARINGKKTRSLFPAIILLKCIKSVSIEKSLQGRFKFRNIIR